MKLKIKKFLVSIGVVATMSSIVPAFNEPMVEADKITGEEFIKIHKIYNEEWKINHVFKDVDETNTVLAILSDRMLAKDVDIETENLINKVKNNEQLTLGIKKTNIINKLIKDFEINQ